MLCDAEIGIILFISYVMMKLGLFVSYVMLKLGLFCLYVMWCWNWDYFVYKLCYAEIVIVLFISYVMLIRFVSNKMHNQIK